MKKWKTDTVNHWYGQPQSNTWKWKKKRISGNLKTKENQAENNNNDSLWPMVKKRGGKVSLSEVPGVVQYSVHCQRDHDTLVEEPCPPFPESLSDTLSGGGVLEDHAASLHWISTLLYSILKHGTVCDINKEHSSVQPSTTSCQYLVSSEPENPARNMLNLPSATPQGYWRPLTFLPFTSITTLLPTTARGIRSCHTGRVTVHQCTVSTTY